MKFLKALGIGIATQLSVTILSVILLLAFCSVSPGGVSVILSGVVALGAYIGFYFKFKKPNVGKAFYWLSFAFIPLVIHTIVMVLGYIYCEKDAAAALSSGERFPALNFLPFEAMLPALFVLIVVVFITGFYELLDAVIKGRNIPDSTSDTQKGADKNDDSL